MFCFNWYYASIDFLGVVSSTDGEVVEKSKVGLSGFDECSLGSAGENYLFLVVFGVFCFVYVV